MPSVAKKLVIVHDNEAPAAEPAAAPAAEAAARPEELRLLEALLFAAGQPLDEEPAGLHQERRHARRPGYMPAAATLTRRIGLDARRGPGYSKRSASIGSRRDALAAG